MQESPVGMINFTQVRHIFIYLLSAPLCESRMRPHFHIRRDTDTDEVQELTETAIGKEIR